MFQHEEGRGVPCSQGLTSLEAFCVNVRWTDSTILMPEMLHGVQEQESGTD